MDLARRLAEALRELRAREELSQTEMAKRLGLSQPTFNRLENAGQNTTLRTLTQLCRALGCDVGDLFGRGPKLRRPVRRRRLRQR